MKICKCVIKHRITFRIVFWNDNMSKKRSVESAADFRLTLKNSLTSCLFQSVSEKIKQEYFGDF